MANDVNSTQIVIKQLETELAGYIQGFNRSQFELEQLQATFRKDFDALERAIEQDFIARSREDKIALSVYEKIGLGGNPLIEALTQVNRFSNSLKKGASAYTPFAIVLLCKF